jgi:hypothetical protein
MKPLLLLALACACATAPGPKRPDESHRIPVNRTTPPEAEQAVKANETSSAERKARREGEVEWR